jgi:two-component system chemotaxis sensor kinase CheA
VSDVTDTPNESLRDLFIYETEQFIEQLEQLVISNETACNYTLPVVNEIFRIMHTIKGSAAMMMLNGISSLAHAVEDLFSYLREENPRTLDCTTLSDLILSGLDFIKAELEKMKHGDKAEVEAPTLIESIHDFLDALKEESCGKDSINTVGLKDDETEKYYKAVIHFIDGSEMENLRAFEVLNDLEEKAEELSFEPKNLEDNDSQRVIREQGFTIMFKTNCSLTEIRELLQKTVFLKDLELNLVQPAEENQNEITTDHFGNKEFSEVTNDEATSNKGGTGNDYSLSHSKSTMISVSVDKLDKLMNLVGEMVLAESMVTQNPDLLGLDLKNFEKSARRLRKINSEIQDTVMAVRMVPLAGTFQKMNRIVRDMCRKLNKEVKLQLKGEETEIDKNIIEHIADPLMHLIRNSIDHGIEMPDQREAKGKPRAGAIILEAQNEGSNVIVTINDDGAGMDKERIISKARSQGLLSGEVSDLTDQEIFKLIFIPGFSTNEDISEFSGRGVGMDVVSQNIAAVGGSITVESVSGQGTVIKLRIPLNLSIIDGMNIKVGKSYYTIPITTIKESFRAKREDIIVDPDNHEMIMVRGYCYPILRIHEIYQVNTDVVDLSEGILVMVEQNGQILCLFADELVGQQQVVIKALPNFNKRNQKIYGLSGCTLLGDGSISLIIDVAGLADLRKTA